MTGNSFDRAPRALARELRVPTLLLAFAAIGLCASLPGPLAADSLEASTLQALPTAIYQQAEPAAPETDAAATPRTRALPKAFAKGVKGMSPKVLKTALAAVSSARARGGSGRPALLTVLA